MMDSGIGGMAQAAASNMNTMMGIGAEALGGVVNYQRNKKMARRAFKRQQWMMLHGPSLQVEGLRRAGLNPILAAGAGMSGAPAVPKASVTRSGLEGTAQALIQGRLARAQIEALRADARKKTAEAVVTETKGPLYKAGKRVLESIVGDLEPLIGNVKSGSEVSDEVQKRIRLAPSSRSESSWYPRYKAVQKRAWDIEPNRPDTSREE